MLGRNLLALAVCVDLGNYDFVFLMRKRICELLINWREVLPEKSASAEMEMRARAHLAVPAVCATRVFSAHPSRLRELARTTKVQS